MATFLALAQKLAKESGTVSGSSQPSSVTGQSGRLSKVVGWTADAWVDIQNMHESWKFRQKEFTSSLISGTMGPYTEGSFSLTDVQKFKGDYNYRDAITIYDPAVGAADEQAIFFIDWETFTREYRRGTHASAKPSYYSIADDGALWVGPTPDKAYTIKGEYVAEPQTLSANDDVPVCPAAFHDAIVWYALVYLAEHDEGPFQMATAQRKYDRFLRDLSRSQLPRPSVRGSALA